MKRNIWIVNDLLTCIRGTKTFWHMLLEIDCTVDKAGIPFNKLAQAIEDDPSQCDLIIRNGTFFRRIHKNKCPQIVLLQDFYGRDDNQIDVCSYAEKVVYNSSFTREKFEAVDDIFKMNAATIPIGVDELLFKPTVQFRPDNDIFDRFKKTGIFVGDYNFTKNTKLFEEIAKENSHIDFKYISKSGYQINLPNIQNYPGGINERGMVRLYNESDFAIMCSPVETLHLTTVEAALCDIPVIGTNTGWFADYFDDSVGTRIDGEHTVDNFSNAIASILENEFSPRKHMLSTPFTWNNCKASWEALIDEVLNER